VRLKAHPLGNEEVHPVNHIFFQHMSPKHQASSPTPELTGREVSAVTCKFSMKSKLIRAPVE